MVTKAAMKKFEDTFSKRYGEETLKRSSEVNPYEVISTGSITLDHRLSVGGYVEGRLVEIWGPDGVGKTTLALMGIAQAQRKHSDKMVAFIDMEQKLDRAWAVAHGVDLENLYVYSPSSAEDVSDALKDFCTSGLFSMVVVDSIGAMIPEVEKEKDADEATMGNQAKIVTRMVKMNAVAAAQTGTVVVLLNQVRANLGYGADTTTGGGWALKHSTTMKFKLKRTSLPPFKVKIGKEERQVGFQLAVQVQRNGVAGAGRTATFNIFTVPTEKYGPIGVDPADEAATIGIEAGVIEQSGAWYTLPGGERVQGRDAVVDELRTNEELRRAVTTASLATVSSEIAEEEAPEENDGKPKFKKGAQVDE